jgi:DNA-binding transcriptional MerR regulator
VLDAQTQTQLSPDGLLSIGQVIVRLRDEFLDISISKIRFLETNGLVTPARTASGYRKFSLVDVERLRYILRMQRDYFLPLKVIREHIDAMDRGLEPPAVTSVAPTPPKSLMSADALQANAQEKAIRLTFEELCEHAQIDASLVEQMVDFGLLKPDSKGYFGNAALRIAQQAAVLHSYGLEPRHLKTVASSAAREVDLFSPILKSASSGQNSASPAQIDELTLHLANGILSLHENIVRALVEQMS